MRPPRRPVAVTLLCVAVWLLPGSAILARGLADLLPEEKQALLSRLQVANAAFDAGRFEEALPLFDALAAEVDVAQIHFRRGACLERLAKPGEAIAAYRRYLELKPDAVDAGRVRFDIQRLEAEVRRLESEAREPPAPASVAPGPGPEAAPGLAAPAPEPPDRTLPWVLAATAAAATVGAGVLGWLTADAIDEANGYDRRAPGHSREALGGLQDDARHYETAFWLVGGTALAAGLTSGLLFLFSGEPGGPVGAASNADPPARVVAEPGALRLRF